MTKILAKWHVVFGSNNVLVDITAAGRYFTPQKHRRLYCNCCIIY